ncbi:UDP-N-acetylglucosamine 2-epimerase [Roseovarius sp. C7]|uniref:UDP-N-acetylglucosamine 2-epimerase n=1 Tax=Roseovarius sp. C7 TaxID=3398643 RepID=UPI0039F69E4D
MLIHYVSGSRADFGLMERCLLRLHSNERFTLKVVVTGQHLSSEYGMTVNDIRTSGLAIALEVPVKLGGASGHEMGLALAQQMRGFLDAWYTERPEFVLLLGDRGEMLAAALAAVHLGIHVGHIHGGECTGTLDESFRHAITKLSHLHFAATEDAARRIIRMGEDPSNVFVIGAPGLVGVAGRQQPAAALVRKSLGLSLDEPLALCVFHPVVQEAESAAKQMQDVIEATRRAGYALVVLRPNSDAGGQLINEYLNTLSVSPELRVFTHLARENYLDLLGVVDLLIGNSSSGIIKSASFGIPCVNVGSRQDSRLRNRNTFDCSEVTASSLDCCIRRAKNWIPDAVNLYGDGTADKQLVELLETVELSPKLLAKRMSY